MKEYSFTITATILVEADNILDALGEEYGCATYKEIYG
tara:strand:+ start:4768 stop:4881 length:114 start_codon:yes stop_codon:yes gene_type:complete